MSLEVVHMSVPQQVSTFPYGRFELFIVGGQQIGRAVYAPGWRWSEHIAPTAGTPLCEVEHLGLVISGHAAVKMTDGTEIVLGPGDFFSIPAGHDSWVVGEQDYVSLHLLGAGQYSTAAGGDTSPE
jgi:quercetin dioxygenase-like cupin family protein